MKKSKIILSVVGILSVLAGIISIKAQHKFGGNYFCTGLLTTATIKYAAIYTTNAAIPVTVTLFCTLNSHVSAPATTKVHIDL